MTDTSMTATDTTLNYHAPDFAPLPTVIHFYRYDTSTPDGTAAYKAFMAERRASGAKLFKAMGGYLHRPAGASLPVLLETKHLHDNQWSTVGVKGETTADNGLPGYRVFDWAEEAIFVNGRENHYLKQGHWLEQTTAMGQVRRERMACGYCGTQVEASKSTTGRLCMHCIGSEYLRLRDLPMLRLSPVCDGHKGRENLPPLTDDETATLTTAWHEARVRLAKKALASEAERLQEEVNDALKRLECLDAMRARGVLGGLEFSSVFVHSNRVHFDAQSVEQAQAVAAALRKYDEQFPTVSARHGWRVEFRGYGGYDNPEFREERAYVKA